MLMPLNFTNTNAFRLIIYKLKGRVQDDQTRLPGACPQETVGRIHVHQVSEKVPLFFTCYNVYKNNVVNFNTCLLVNGH